MILKTTADGWESGKPCSEALERASVSVPSSYLRVIHLALVKNITLPTND